MNPPNPLLEIHLAVLLFGLASLFGKWVALPAVIIVLGRVAFAVPALALVLRWAGQSIRLNRRQDYLYLSLLGVLLAFHWVTFFESVQVSTVAVCLVSYSTFPFFTVFLEPLFFREPLSRRGLALAIVALAGVALVIPEWKLGNNTTLGVFWGVLSGISFALLSVLNRKYVRTYSSLQVAFYQDLVAFLLLLPFWFLLQPTPSASDWGLIVVLGVVFTAFSHTLFINGLKEVPARTASIIATLEPVYGIIAAALLLGEIPGVRVLAGGMLIIGAMAYASWKPVG
ncbi:MAG: EamA family transporter [Lewinellaceae bacterium]|nr:EamA family transporter [Phaeodactylibacter sp.]MCB9040507.1 EamA family transporter [Lewinellaceae bacterium]